MDMPDVNAAIEKPEAQLCELLSSAGKLNPTDRARAERAADAGQGRLHHLLVRLGIVNERDMAAALAEMLDLPLATSADFPIIPVAAECLSQRFLQEALAIPLAVLDDSIDVAVSDPLDDFTRQAIALATGLAVTLRVGLPGEIEAALKDIYGRPDGADAVADELDGLVGDGDEDLETLRDLAREAPVIRIVNLLIARAVEDRASDIHLESFRGHLALRYRIDGGLVEIEPPPLALRAAIISRIKIMAGLDIAERRLPQDGRIRAAVRGQSVDLRVSTLPMMHGESVVLRILDRSGLDLKLEALGFGAQTATTYRRALAAPNGIVLITGPTGSGKTSTLYASMLEIQNTSRKIVTVEDPVEYELPGVNQIQTQSGIGLTFAATLRSILRHDPDIIMIGEIRDRETAEIAVQAALTGHLVLSTLHTNSAAAAISRLLDMDIESYLLTSTLEMVVAQRLVRRLCPECRQAYQPSPELVGRLALQGDTARLWRPVGCSACNGRGFRGRMAVLEAMSLDETLNRAILRAAHASELHQCAVDGGMIPIYQDGLVKALAGETTLDEVMRVAREA